MKNQLARHYYYHPPGDHSLKRDSYYHGQMEIMYGEMVADVAEILDHIISKILLINKTMSLRDNNNKNVLFSWELVKSCQHNHQLQWQLTLLEHFGAHRRRTWVLGRPWWWRNQL